MIEEDFPIAVLGTHFLTPEGVPPDEVGFIRFTDHRGMLRGVGFGPAVDVQLMAEQVSALLGIPVQFRLPGAQHFYELP